MTGPCVYVPGLSGLWLSLRLLGSLAAYSNFTFWLAAREDDLIVKSELNPASCDFTLKIFKVN